MGFQFASMSGLFGLEALPLQGELLLMTPLFRLEDCAVTSFGCRPAERT